MRIETFIDILGADFYTGVPDSQLKPLCDYLVGQYGISENHIIAANEGNAVAIAAGYHLATGKVPVVYMQNSGIGNMINPMASLLHKKVYAIPCMFIVGWRGEPGIHDEPQHVFQGEVTVRLLEDMEITTYILAEDTTADELKQVMEKFQKVFAAGESAALIIKKGALTTECKMSYHNSFSLKREEILEKIVEYTRDDSIISTTGKASRELFEIRERRNEGHAHDFLTVGSMGHASSIALGIALKRPGKKIWCIDGDGAAIMHLGAMAVIGKSAPDNLVHVVINNQAHETVGGMPTAADHIDMVQIALGCGYSYADRAVDMKELGEKLAVIQERPGLSFLEIKASLGARKDLGRPTTSPVENKNEFMKALQEDHSSDK